MNREPEINVPLDANRQFRKPSVTDGDSVSLSEREIFFEAFEIVDCAARNRFLEEICGDNQRLLEGVRKLLEESDSESRLFIDQPLFKSELIGAFAGQTHQAGVTIGPYALEQRLGEGGMGEVWLATQLEPVKRRVALKLIRPGRESPGVLQRFEAERQALAAMDHPGIARVLDARNTDSGQPCFIMELVNGAPLIQFCDEARLTIHERLKIFVQVALAVQHAHQKAIIHRDLKPSNILVTVIDGCPVPKIIDFGLAKALQGKLTVDSLSTQFGMVIGTMEYMAPEQAGYSGQDVDTRADIYSLGVVLYELLTGLRPFESCRFKDAPIDEMLRIIKEDEPASPSTRLSTSESALKTANVRRTEPGRLSSLLRNDLDWIVMKALEKDRSRRYQTASDLAEDISRYLAGEPVAAHPPSRAYRAQKYFRKNRGLVVAAAAVLTSLVLGIAGTTFGLIKSNRNAQLFALEAEKSFRAETLARSEKADAETARNDAISAAEEEKRQRKFADAIADFITADFLELTTVEGRLGLIENQFAISAVDNAPEKEATLKHLLDRAADKLVQRNDLGPDVDFQLQRIVGLSYLKSGQPVQAIPFLERAANLRIERDGVDHETTATALNTLAVALAAAGQERKAHELITKLLETSRRVFGEEDENTMAFTINLAILSLAIEEFEKAIPLCETALEWIDLKFGANDIHSISPLTGYAVALERLGETERAFAAIQRALVIAQNELGKDHLETLVVMNNLASLHQHQGDNTKTIRLTEEILELLNNRYGDDHHFRANVLLTRGKALRAAGHRELVVDTLQESLALHQQKFGENHPATLGVMHTLALAWLDVRQLDKAIPMFEQTYASRRALLGDHDVATLHTLNALATAYLDSGDAGKALPLLEKTVKQRTAIYGANDPRTLDSMNSLAATFRQLGQPEKALVVFRTILERQQEIGGDQLAKALTTMNNIAFALYDLKKADEAIAMMDELLTKKLARYSQAHPSILLTMYNLAGMKHAVGHRKDAIQIYEQLVGLTRTRFGDNHPETLRVRASWLATRAEQSREHGDFAEAVDELQQVLEIHRQMTTDQWLRFRTESELGDNLLRLEEYDKARPFLESGFEGLKELQATIPPQARKCLGESIERLIDLAEASQDETELKKWRSEREKLISLAIEGSELDTDQ